PFSRLGPYDRRRLDELVYRRREFTEQWAHEASIVPVDAWPLLEHRRHDHRVRPWGFEEYLAALGDYSDRVLEEVRRRGPLGVDDLPEPTEKIPQRLGDKWGWSLKLKRQFLEAHFGFGRLVVADRLPNFARRYDLPERVVTAQHLARKLEPPVAQRELLRRAARAHGVASARDLADYWRMPIGDARRRLAELVECGELRQVEVEGWPKPAFLDPQARLPRRVSAAALLSPFDPLVWCRPRISRLFGFDYAIEIYVPKEKRRWGYYVLPFLLGDRLVARVDLKADRRARRLLVQSAWIEPGAEREAVSAALAGELSTLAGWLGLARIEVRRRGDLADLLTTALA
ncbi:MAG: winged helix-turn-helix domain-containing protein, partial [Thermoanaerobaculia bacterium]